MDVIDNQDLNFLKRRCADMLGVPEEDFMQPIGIPDPVAAGKHRHTRIQLIGKLMHLFCAASAARCSFCLRPMTEGNTDAEWDHLVSQKAQWAGSARYRKQAGKGGDPALAIRDLKQFYEQVKYTRACHHQCNMDARSSTRGTGAAH